ncbi:hypothetical protein MNBD_GAMMA18-821 [hydrothermal vent metagenome]|uniref:Uncharacterized protein n=1 Tax=hydrothermal vent metagenome TaxID=652676 RepID=A0A3B0Z1E0_9ZZZZ
MNGSAILIILWILVLWLPSCQSVQRNIDVISMERKIDTESPDYEICSSFTLTKKTVVDYFSVAKEVSGDEFHHESIILPCKYQGSMKIDDTQFQWEIFAGGSGYLYNKSTEKRYLCKETCCDILKGLC